MPDKRDMHKAKSHRNSKSSRQAAKSGHGRQSAGTPGADTMVSEGSETRIAPEMAGKKNKSRR